MTLPKRLTIDDDSVDWRICPSNIFRYSIDTASTQIGQSSVVLRDGGQAESLKFDSIGFEDWILSIYYHRELSLKLEEKYEIANVRV